jgi:hypothetical protein
MNNTINRRRFLLSLGALGILPKAALALSPESAGGEIALIGAAWRGPNPGDPYFAGVLAADWNRKKLEIRYAVPLPTRPHGLLPEADGGLLVTGVRPGSWLLRCAGDGQVTQQISVEDEASSARLNGHAIVSRNGEVIYTSETDAKTGCGKIGVRDRRSLRKLDEWETSGMEPHQVLLDKDGHVVVANGGIPRTAADKKYDLQRMDSSLVRLDGQSGRLLRKWQLDDPRLSLRHLAWSHSPAAGKTYLGVAMQAEHDDPAKRAAAPILAVLDGDVLSVPTRANDGIGYAGDISAAYNGGFALSSNQAGLAQLWHPGSPDKLTPIVELQEAYALTTWPGPNPGGGVLVSTALGLVRWHPTAKPALLPWPKKMAVDNHWVLMSEA